MLPRGFAGLESFEGQSFIGAGGPSFAFGAPMAGLEGQHAQTEGFLRCACGATAVCSGRNSSVTKFGARSLK